MSILTDTFTLANGAQIPQLGFGTWQIPDGAEAYDSVAAALRAGYRHIDTALAYGNEASVGRAIADSGLARDDVFVTTKLPAEIKTFDGAVTAFETSLAGLGLDAVDLYLIHAPWPWSDRGGDYAAGNAEVWRAMEGFHDDGRARAIGVSNFEVADLTKLAETARVVPLANQIKLYIGHDQDDVLAYCREHGILVEGYSPLATGRILSDPQVKAVADRYGVSVARLCVRYVLQKGALPLPKTTSPTRMVENADIDFEIGADDMAYLDGLTDAGSR